MVCQALLVALLDRSPLLLERRVVDVLEQTLELRQVLEEGGLGDLEGLADEVTEPGVALVTAWFSRRGERVKRGAYTWSSQRRGVTEDKSALGHAGRLVIVVKTEYALPFVTLENLIKCTTR